MLRPLLMHRARGLCGPLYHKAANLRTHLVHGTGNFISAHGFTATIADFLFVAGYKAETDVQNVQNEGEILNLMPKGTVTATSVHPAPIAALDYQGASHDHAVNAPVWQGARLDGVDWKATLPSGADIVPHPWLMNDGTFDYIYPAANIDPADSIVSFQLLADGRDCTVLDIGGVPLLTYGDFAVDGNELVVNGTFDVDSDWTLEDGFTISGGEAHYTAGNTGREIYQAISVAAGVVYRMQYDLASIDDGLVGFYCVESSDATSAEYKSVAGVYFTDFTATGISAILRWRNNGAANSIFSMDNVSVQKLVKGLKLDDGSGNVLTIPVADGDRDIDVVLTATAMELYVDDALAGTAAYTPIAAGSITTNATHYALRRNEAPALSLGTEEVTNGDFENGDTGWTGLNVVGGVANTIATTGYQVISTIPGQNYDIKFKCDAVGVSPQLQVQNGNVTGSPVIAEVNPSGNGVMEPYSTTFTALSVDSIIILSNGSNTALWDNISVKRV